MQAVRTSPRAGVAVPVPTTDRAATAANAEPRATIVQSVAAPDPAVENSASQHVFLPPRGLTAKLLLRFLIVGLATILVAGAGYLKFRSARRVRISDEVMEKLKAASSSLPGADLRVSVSDDREVTMEGAVRAAEDSSLAESIASAVPGVVHVRNRLIVVPTVPTVPTETTESLVNKGVSFLDAGDYTSAIDCFRKALADPNNKGAQELLDRAQRAQQTEEELLKNRR
jgi:tetratricopeptide (TPR) repeat protein